MQIFDWTRKHLQGSTPQPAAPIGPIGPALAELSAKNRLLDLERKWRDEDDRELRRVCRENYWHYRQSMQLMADGSFGQLPRMPCLSAESFAVSQLGN
jgi:hypothetical protein